MEAVAQKLLAQGAHTVRIVTPPEDVEKGWDVADANWSSDEAADYIRHNFTELSAPETTSVLEPEEPAKQELTELDVWLSIHMPWLSR